MCDKASGLETTRFISCCKYEMFSLSPVASDGICFLRDIISDFACTKSQYYFIGVFMFIVSNKCSIDAHIPAGCV